MTAFCGVLTAYNVRSTRRKSNSAAHSHTDTKLAHILCDFQRQSGSRFVSNTKATHAESATRVSSPYGFRSRSPLTFGSAACEVIGDGERARVLTAEGLAHSLQRLAEQQLSGGEIALGVQ